MIVVRRAEAHEAPLVHRITQEAFEDLRGILDPPSGVFAETLDDVISSLEKGGAPIAFVDNDPAGAARFAFMEDHVYCGRVGVLRTHRRKGVAAALLEFIETIAQKNGFHEVRLATRAHLEDNIRLYERLGYEIVGRSRHPRGPDMVIDFAKKVC